MEMGRIFLKGMPQSTLAKQNQLGQRLLFA